MRPFPLLVNSGTISKVGEQATQAAEAAPGAAAQLVPYLPRVSLEWLGAAPEARHRALDGTLAFVDVSGFTAMSERLAPKGRLGAEEVTDVMSATFTRLLAVAYANGGGLVKFGGDALLLFFDGDSHTARACNAAFGMRRTLEELGALGHVCRERDAADARRNPQRGVRLLPRRRVAPRTDHRRPRSGAHRRDGGRR